LIPLRDNQPTSSFPIVTILIIVANVLAFLAQQVYPLITASMTMVPYEITQHVDHRPVLTALTSNGPIHIHPVAPHPLWLTIFTSMFLHASLLHLGANMLYFWIFGNNIEDALGKLRFIAFYFLCGIAAAAAQILASPDSSTPVLGASGAIAGVLGAYYLLYPNARVLSIVPFFLAFLVEVRASLVLGLWFLLEVIQGIEGMGMQQGGGVAVYAHIGGFLAGIILISIFGGRKLARGQRRIMV
jgi:membrane associated rhomboid family serine protease